MSASVSVPNLTEISEIVVFISSLFLWVINFPSATTFLDQGNFSKDNIITEGSDLSGPIGLVLSACQIHTDLKSTEFPGCLWALHRGSKILELRKPQVVQFNHVQWIQKCSKFGPKSFPNLVLPIATYVIGGAPEQYFFCDSWCRRTLEQFDPVDPKDGTIL